MSVWKTEKHKKVVCFYAQMLSSVRLPFLLCATFWFIIPIKMSAIKKEANEIAPVANVNTYKKD
ncbi:hypothetical protein [Bacillus thuringiensis]|nr:hypothetical protein [Bacillus thuringiensis]EKS8367517.1 hypothetical protein [Bacillus cereus]EKS8373773.1 hypothetical protein [Bacillus cereus]MED3393017.1 hypothetical protein [Bacillus thuringiensis]